MVLQRSLFNSKQREARPIQRRSGSIRYISTGHRGSRWYGSSPVILPPGKADYVETPRLDCPEAIGPGRQRRVSFPLVILFLDVAMDGLLAGQTDLAHGIHEAPTRNGIGCALSKPDRRRQPRRRELGRAEAENGLRAGLGINWRV